MRETPTMMLGRTTGRFARALPAGVGATFPGSGGPNEMTEVGRYPSLQMNYITNPPSVPPLPNPGRVFDGGPSFKQPPVGASTGLPIRNMLLSGLAATPARVLVAPGQGNRNSFTMGVLGVGLGAIRGLAGEETADMTLVSPVTDPTLAPCLSRVGDLTYAQLWQGRAAMLCVLGSVVAGVHGYHRNKGHFGWTAGWAAAGFFFPVITTGVALFQGLGKR